ncbi:hypothetical protein PZN02_003473 [Sinorhizobium garamanticum]|uniref:Uncharacterized protein n=1 Tax=Sinorhizobium garamanticum TaxID=680247 RepID=A0ABY8DAM9_9HYPH|nr:hypothetical protein [Sinorhizobium garamanticum]WEX87117.1 hypothetical protein PZN02_003473 [Sinorhizobium garamanticum]
MANGQKNLFSLDSFSRSQRRIRAENRFTLFLIPAPAKVGNVSTHW